MISGAERVLTYVDGFADGFRAAREISATDGGLMFAVAMTTWLIGIGLGYVIARARQR